MPEEEKEKPRFKAVTEEITSEVSHPHPQEHSHEHHPHHEHSHHEPPMSEPASPDGSQGGPVAATELPVNTTPVPETDNIAPLIPIVEKKSSFKSVLGFFAIMIGVAFVIAFAMGGVYTYISGTKDNEPTSSPIPTSEAIVPIEPTAIPTPSSTPIPLGNYKVSVLNGSGMIGEAGKVKAILEKIGFKVSYTGNAESFDLDNTIIQVKATVSSDVVKKLQDGLKSSYTTTVGDTLDAKSKYDIIVSVGAK